MKHLKTYKLFEKSSLTYLGVPDEVMVDVQKQFALSDDAQWKKLQYKKDLRTELRKDGDKLFVVVSEDKNNVIVIFSVDKDFYVDNYRFYKSDDMGDEYWDKEDRIESTITDINKYVPRGAKIYKLLSGDWTYENRAKRKLKKYEYELKEFTDQFKRDFADNFTKIVKKLYKRNAELIQKIIMRNLINIDKNISSEKAKKILSSNVDKAKQSDFFRKKGEEQDPFKLQLQYIRDNSLTIFNEFLITFEEKMSEKYSEFLNIYELCKRYSIEKIQTAFIYYLYSGKIMDL